MISLRFYGRKSLRYYGMMPLRYDVITG